MMRLIRSELVKFASTKGGGALGGIAAALPILAIALLSFAGQLPTVLGSEQGRAVLVALTMTGSMFLAIAGLLGITSEFQHATATGTFLHTPRRTRVLLAKTVTYGLVGMVSGLVGAAGSAGITIGALAATGDLAVVEASMALACLGLVISASGYGMIGVGVGMVLHNQAAGLVVLLVWFTFLEAWILGMLPTIGMWLPGGAQAALIGSYGFAPGYDQHLLPMWAGATLLLGYVGILTGIGSRIIHRLDIT